MINSGEWRVTSIVSGRIKQRGYIATSASGGTVIIDPGEDEEKYFELLEEVSNVELILLTHGHFDHIASACRLQSALKLKVVIHELDIELMRQANLYQLLFGGKSKISIPKPDIIVKTLNVESSIYLSCGAKIKIHHMPGHTPGSCVFELGSNLFVGDLLNGLKLGRTDLPGGDLDHAIQSVQRLLEFPDDYVSYSGHSECWKVEDLRRELAGCS